MIRPMMYDIIPLNPMSVRGLLLACFPLKPTRTLYPKIESKRPTSAASCSQSEAASVKRGALTQSRTHAHVPCQFPCFKWAPWVFYAYSYNHAHRIRLEKLLYLEIYRSPNGLFKHCRIQVAVSLLKPPKEVKRPLHGGCGSETAKNLTAIFNAHPPTDASVRSGVTEM